MISYSRMFLRDDYLNWCYFRELSLWTLFCDLLAFYWIIISYVDHMALITSGHDWPKISSLFCKWYFLGIFSFNKKVYLYWNNINDISSRYRFTAPFKLMTEKCMCSKTTLMQPRPQSLHFCIEFKE